MHLITSAEIKKSESYSKVTILENASIASFPLWMLATMIGCDLVMLERPESRLAQLL